MNTLSMMNVMMLQPKNIFVSSTRHAWGQMDLNEGEQEKARQADNINNKMSRNASSISWRIKCWSRDHEHQEAAHRIWWSMLEQIIGIEQEQANKQGGKKKGADFSMNAAATSIQSMQRQHGTAAIQHAWRRFKRMAETETGTFKTAWIVLHRTHLKPWQTIDWW